MQPYQRITKKQLGELLIERGVINHEQLKIGLETQKESGGLIGEILVELKFATERDIAQALTLQYGFPYLPLANYEIGSDVLLAVPENLCWKYILIPIDKIGKSLTLAMANPTDLVAIEEVEKVTESQIQAFVSTSSEIKQAIDQYYSHSNS